MGTTLFAVRRDHQRQCWPSVLTACIEPSLSPFGLASANHIVIVRSILHGSRNGTSQLEAKQALIEVAVSVDVPLAGSAAESARSLYYHPVTSPMEDVGAYRTGHIVTGDGERVAIGRGQRLVVDVRNASRATTIWTSDVGVPLVCA